MKKLAYIDALRGLAILAVIVVHTNQFGNHLITNIISKILGQGARGVQLFYIASAFTLFLSFNNRYLKEQFHVRNFFLRRFFRIAPMYYIGILYYLFQDGLGPRYHLGDASHISALNILSNFFFVHGINPYWITSVVPGGWSISVEMTFYAILPLIFFRIKNARQAFIFFILCVAVMLMLHTLLAKFPLIGDERLWLEFLYFYFPSQLPVFALGILMYYLITGTELIRKIYIPLGLSFAALLAIQWFTGILLIHILFGIGFLFLGVFLSKYPLKIIVNPIINYIGKVSFSMYLVHFAVLHWLRYFNLIDYAQNPMLNYVMKYAVVTLITVAISSILYYLIEVPFQNLGKRWIGQWEKKKPIPQIS